MAPAIALAKDGFVLDQGDADILAQRHQGFRQGPERRPRSSSTGRQALRRPATGWCRRTSPRRSQPIAKDGAGRLLQGPDRRRRSSPRASANGGILAEAGFRPNTRSRETGAGRVRLSRLRRSSPRRRRARAASSSARSSTSWRAIRWHRLGYRFGRRACTSWSRRCATPIVDRNIDARRSRISSTTRSRGCCDKDYAGDIRAKIDPFRAGVVARPEAGRGAARGQRDDALFDRRQGRQRGRGDLHAERLVRRRGRSPAAPASCSTTRWTTSPPSPACPTSSAWSRARPTPSRPASAAELDEPDHRRQGRQAVHGDRQPRRVAHHHHHAGGDRQRRSTTAWTSQEAVDAPRIHHQWLPDKIFIEKRALSPDTRALLTGMGYSIEEQGYWGSVEAIMIGPNPGAGDSSRRARLAPGDGRRARDLDGRQRRAAPCRCGGRLLKRTVCGGKHPVRNSMLDLRRSGPMRGGARSMRTLVLAATLWLGAMGPGTLPVVGGSRATAVAAHGCAAGHANPQHPHRAGDESAVLDAVGGLSSSPPADRQPLYLRRRCRDHHPLSLCRR